MLILTELNLIIKENVMEKIKVGIIGPGNIGLDLLNKIERSPYLELATIVGVAESKGISYARDRGYDASPDGIQHLLDAEGIKIAFDCTSAAAHFNHAPLLEEAGIFTLDLTPAAIGPHTVPAVNLTDEMLNLPNLNMVTCAGQATSPIVYAINRVANVKYAEVVSSISSKSAGPGTRANIDEFTVTTKEALINVGGADEAKVIIVLNPAEPPIHMRNTIYTMVENPDLDLIRQSVDEMVEKIKEYVPGYRYLLEPIIQNNIVTTMIEVEGLGDYLPVYSGNLDIITSAAVSTAEKYAKKIMGGER